MSKVTGLLERAHTNAKGISSILVNGTWYGTYKTSHKDKEGSTVEFDADQNGQYWNAKNVSVTAPPAASATGGAPMGGDDRQKSIVLQSSYKTAAEVLVGMLAAGAVQLPAKKGDQYDAILGFLDAIAMRLYGRCINAAEFVAASEAPGPGTDTYNPVEA